MNISNNKIWVSDTISNHSKHKELVTIRSRTSKKVDSSTTVLPPVTTKTLIPSTTKIKSTRTTRPRTTTLRTTRIRKITEKPPKTARPSNPSSSSCTIS
ncbi:unnamed protein product [Adineta steineri]|uniref:Uncharacterized protein n=1 Tax=Adineta steineri TaxID=433720 RepID=A0A819TAV5_9BILA|nr:unnamed protein product [Adineta steineri]